MRHCRVVRVGDDMHGEKQGNGSKAMKHLMVRVKPLLPNPPHPQTRQKKLLAWASPLLFSHCLEQGEFMGIAEADWDKAPTKRACRSTLKPLQHTRS